MWNKMRGGSTLVLGHEHDSHGSGPHVFGLPRVPAVPLPFHLEATFSIVMHFPFVRSGENLTLRGKKRGRFHELGKG